MSCGALSKTFGTRPAMAPAFLAACDTAQVVQCLGEALNASWRDFDFQKGLFEVYRPKSRSISGVPLTPRLRALLMKPHNAAAKPFMQMRGAIRLLRSIMQETCNLVERINKQRGKAIIHSLRDTFASKPIAEGMRIYELAKLPRCSHTSKLWARPVRP